VEAWDTGLPKDGKKIGEKERLVFEKNMNVI